jgi:hypothetical protein
VSFNAEAFVVAGWTSDKAALAEALNSVAVASGSRLDAGILMATELLAEAAPGSIRRMVVVTDGLPSPSTPDDARAAADAARRAGATIDVVGLGTDVEPGLLRDLAGGGERFHEAPDGEDLLALFQDLSLVPRLCPGVVTWPNAAQPAGSAPFAPPARTSHATKSPARRSPARSSLARR